VVARALSQATAVGIADYRPLAERAYRRVLSQQQEDGGFRFYSRANYGLLSDRRSYPRYLCMILFHLLDEIQVQITPLLVTTSAQPA
jgi:hypothetical protein